MTCKVARWSVSRTK